MTRDLAINILTEHIRLMGDEPSLEEDRQAFEFAISALEEQEPCEDAVSRAEALDQLEQAYNIMDATDRVKAMPSVQAVCDDAISREAVKNEFKCWIGSGEYRKPNGSDYLGERLRNLPSVQPSRKGQWKYFYQNYECSECGFVVADSDVETDGYEFCPICGSYNGGDTNG